MIKLNTNYSCGIFLTFYKLIQCTPQQIFVVVYIGSSHDFSITEIEAETTLKNEFRKWHYKKLGVSSKNPCWAAVRKQTGCFHCHKSSVRPNLKTSPLQI